MKDLSKGELHAYEFVKLKKEVSKKEYKEYAGVSDKTAQRRLSKLRKEELVGDNDEPLESNNYKYVFIDD